MMKILIIDDSQTETALLKKIFESVPDMKVVGCAANGKKGVELVAQLKPDIITMDIDMPVMDGLEATRIIMAQHPTPIVVISVKTATEAMQLTFAALEAGALSVLSKPFNISGPNYEREQKRIIDTVRSMAEIKVVKRRFRTKQKEEKKPIPVNVPHKRDAYEIIAIGTSVGGPQALKTIITKLPADFPVPIVVVQHMALGFISGFVQWLDTMSAVKVKEADNFEILKPGVVYFAPENVHITVDRNDNKLLAKLIHKPPVSGFCPSATVLLQSIAKICGPNAIGILLTGMGNDGAEGLLEVKHAKGHTLIQDPDSAVVFGMAGVAQSLNAVDKVVELEEIANYLIESTKSS